MKEREQVSTRRIIGDDAFFEIIEPKQLRYTYKVRPAQDFGVPFVSKKYLT